MIDTLRRSHEAFGAAASEAPWLRDLRGAALARAQQLGFPGAHLESWKYTSTRALAEVPFEHRAAGPEAAVEALVAPHRLPHAVAELVLVDGRLAPGLSRLPQGGEVVVLPLAQALATHEAQVREQLGRLAAWQDEAFTALNVAFLQDGLYLRVPRGVDLSGPVHVIAVAQAGAAPGAAHLRHLVVAERGSRAAVIETFLGEGDAATLTNAVTEVVVEDDAEVRHAAVGLQGEAATLLHTVEARLGRGARWRGHVSWLGGSLTRSNVRVVHAAEGASAWLDGLYVLGGRQHVDNHIVVDHVAPRCTTREAYKAVLGGRAKGIFDGTVIVRQDAQHTDSVQESRNLLVSDDADAAAKPILEIYADDVKCGHGTTVGQLDRQQLDYLTSRGIPRVEARRILTAAFAADRVEALFDEALRERVRAEVDRRLVAIQCHAPEPA